MPIIGCEDIAGFIKNRYPRGSRVIEVGVGHHSEVAALLSGHFEVVCTDVTENGPDGIAYVKDDIFEPDLKAYEGARLIYSIRPPVDMQGPMAAIAKKIGADLLIRPFSSERADLRKYFRNFKCLNYGDAVFYLYYNDQAPARHPAGLLRQRP